MLIQRNKSSSYCIDIYFWQCPSNLFQTLFQYSHFTRYFGLTVLHQVLVENKTIYLTFICPCIFRYIPYIQPTRCHFSQFIYFNNALHVSGGTPHPTSGARTVHTASGICQTLLLPVAIMIAAGSSKVWQVPEGACTVWAPDDGWRFHPKRVECYWNK
jgi:hypothetical protein